LCLAPRPPRTPRCRTWFSPSRPWRPWREAARSLRHSARDKALDVLKTSPIQSVRVSVRQWFKLNYPMKSPLKFAASCAFAFALAGLVRAADIDGKWKAEFDSQIGVQKYVFELKADGEKLTGKAKAERAQLGNTETAITNGKI